MAQNSLDEVENAVANGSGIVLGVFSFGSELATAVIIEARAIINAWHFASD